MKNKISITVFVSVDATAERIWEFWTLPSHITKWNNASDEWHTITATNDLKVGGKFKLQMAAKDGSMGFDFEGIYHTIETNKLLAYTLDDGRNASVAFTNNNNKTTIVETFEAEAENPIEIQKMGWQRILNNF